MLHVSSSRNLILNGEDCPKIGDKVVTEDLKFVGSVFDIIGSVSSPYITVKPVIMKPQSLVNAVLYRFPSDGKRKEKKKYGR